jgi:hypothetical protein
MTARDVEDDGAGATVLEARHCLVGADRQRAIASTGEKTAEHVAGGRLALDDEDVFGSLVRRRPHACHVSLSYASARSRHLQSKRNATV